MYLKSDQEKHQKIPTYGAALYLFITILVLNLTGLLLSQSVLQSGLLKGEYKDLFYLIGILLMLVAARIQWLSGVKSGVSTSIQSNELKTTGIYERTRNPIYFSWWLSSIGITLTMHNMWLLILIPIQWVLLTVVIRITDEKWLYELHGEAYKDYCARVNRWIPIKKIK
ncbi:isoprenylcysteine carboxylmethyltransferase family protein [uncultured Granulicatella sp.]|uniref:methyltransferase family protein n=1 Tax=uncultured Granulicatella sp. TaxID=316089 RepID=UPI00261039D7|nr:isoprenylcysteine carboxylmethyltransferase family protein [uncultured Granulicatella sp.]